jgi:Flp pilus assembly protein TadD
MMMLVVIGVTMSTNSAHALTGESTLTPDTKMGGKGCSDVPLNFMPDLDPEKSMEQTLREWDCQQEIWANFLARQARAKMNEGKYEFARFLLEKALEIHPMNERANELHAIASAELNE